MPGATVIIKVAGLYVQPAPCDVSGQFSWRTLSGQIAG